LFWAKVVRGSEVARAEKTPLMLSFRRAPAARTESQEQQTVGMEQKLKSTARLVAPGQHMVSA
jgi:hypothetical protein